MERLKKDIINFFEKENIENASKMVKEFLEKIYKDKKINEKEYNELKIFIQQQIRKNIQIIKGKNAIINFLKMRKK